MLVAPPTFSVAESHRLSGWRIVLDLYLIISKLTCTSHLLLRSCTLALSIKND